MTSEGSNELISQHHDLSSAAIERRPIEVVSGCELNGRTRAIDEMKHALAEEFVWAEKLNHDRGSAESNKPKNFFLSTD